LVPLSQHFHISAINAAAFTKQRNAALFDRRRQQLTDSMGLTLKSKELREQAERLHPSE